MFSATTTQGSAHHHYQIIQAKQPVAFRQVLDLWQTSEPFRCFFIQLLTESPFRAYRWETPALSWATLERPFEFVLVNSPRLNRPPDPKPFQEHFTPGHPGIVVFENLGRDALMVVPCPWATDSVYPHLATFVRQGPSQQIHALW
jgi:hypothetical protein